MSLPSSTLSLLIALACLASLLHAAPAPVDAEAEKRLVAAATTSRAAYFKIETSRVGLAEDDLISHRGFFISRDGLAVAPLAAFDHGKFKASLESDQSPLTIEGVVAADFATGLAIVRVTPKPARWLSLQKDDAPLGERIAIYRPEEHGGTVTAYLIAKRKVAQARSRTYCDMFSIGANLGEIGGTYVPAGTPVLDAGGQVAAILTNPFVTTRQRFLLAFPASVIRAKVPENAASAATIPFPLPKSLLPVDPLALNATYLFGRRAQLTGNLLEAERLLRHAVTLEPESAAGWERLGFVLRDLRRDQDAMAAFDRAADHGNELAVFEINRADHLRLMNKVKEATEVLAAACIKIPHDYDLHRAYALALRMRKDERGAEKHLRLAVKLAPDVISCWELLSKSLAAQGKWDIEKIASDRIHQLESLYRTR